MKRSKIIVLFSVVVLVFSLFSIVFYSFINNPLEKKVIHTSLTVSNKSGFDLNKSSLEFGKVIPGSVAQRNLKLGNDYGFEIYAQVSCKGNISEILDYDEEIFIEKDEEKEISFVAKPLKNKTEYSYYSGEITVEIYKAE